MKITLDELSVIVADYYKLTTKELFKKSRKKHIVYPRKMFCYLAYYKSGKTLSKIGLNALKYGREEALDHATVLHARDWIKNDMFYKETSKDIINLTEKINQFLTKKNKPIEIIVDNFDLLKLCEHKRQYI